MKEGMNKEMDLLLRRLSRRQDSSTSNGDASIVGEHLDADELSSYAENALPAAARARYTEHLAECSGCRELIVQISSSIGVVAQSAKVPAPSGLRNFLASLFSPMVLRYAIPAVGLIVVAAIGFFSLRQDRGALMTQQADAPAARSNESPGFNDSQSGIVGQLNSSDKNTAPTVETYNAPRAKSSPAGDIAAPPNVAPLVDLRAEVSKDAEAKKADDQQTAANAAPAPQPTAAPVVATEEANKAKNEPPKEVSQRAVSDLAVKQPSTTSEFEKSKKIRRDQEVAGAGAGSRTEGSANAERSTRERAPSPSAGRVLRQADGTDQSESVETRSVAGRRFRKQGNLWIDTGFNSGTNTVNVSRGSEQFRALVADEPEIKTIAEQLGGEIIVVWKGRAYRIR